MLNAAGVWRWGCKSFSGSTAESWKEMWRIFKEVKKCVLWFIFLYCFFDHIFIDYIFITNHIFVILCLSILQLLRLYFLFYWFIDSWMVFFYIIMVRKQDVFSLHTLFAIIRSEIVLGFIFFLECLLWNIVRETELGKRFASFGWDEVV